MNRSHRPTVEERVNRAYHLLVLIGAASAAATEADTLLPEYESDDVAAAIRIGRERSGRRDRPTTSCTSVRRELDAGGGQP